MNTLPRTRTVGAASWLTGLGLVALALVAWGADFNGDLRADLAIGVPGEDVSGTVLDAGALNVLYGSVDGISATGNQYWTQSDLISPEGSEPGEGFARALAAGDFDGDGEFDLAVGVTGEAVGSSPEGGAVQILYGGSPDGLGTAGTQLWHQDSPGVLGSAEHGDWFGSSLATGDFDGDGYDDLAVGVPKEDIGSIPDAGAVNVLYGSVAGLAAAGNQICYEGYQGLGGAPEDFDGFGAAIAAGDFDRDGFDDLAVGIPYQDFSSIDDVGRVDVLYGSPTGLSPDREQSWVQGVAGLPDLPEHRDTFGRALVSGDFDGDGFDDLAVGAPTEDEGGARNTGAVQVLFGSPTGLTPSGNQLWFDHELAADTLYGLSLTAGDFDGDSEDELAIGIPHRETGGVHQAGAVEILHGSASGLIRRGTDDLWHQDRIGVEGDPTDFDEFGRSLAAGDFDGDGRADLAVGVPGDVAGAVSYGGAVQLFYGTETGITATGSQLWHQDSPGVEGEAQNFDEFGMALAAVPPRTAQPIFADDFEAGDLGRWSAIVPGTE